MDVMQDILLQLGKLTEAATSTKSQVSDIYRQVGEIKDDAGQDRAAMAAHVAESVEFRLAVKELKKITEDYKKVKNRALGAAAVLVVIGAGLHWAITTAAKLWAAKPG